MALGILQYEFQLRISAAQSSSFFEKLRLSVSLTADCTTVGKLSDGIVNYRARFP